MSHQHLNTKRFLLLINSNFSLLLRSQKLWLCWAPGLLQRRWAESKQWTPPPHIPLRCGAHQGDYFCPPCSLLLPWHGLLLSSYHCCLFIVPYLWPPPPPHPLPALGLPLLDILLWLPMTYRRKPMFLSLAFRGLNQWLCSPLHLLSLEVLSCSTA